MQEVEAPVVAVLPEGLKKKKLVSPEEVERQVEIDSDPRVEDVRVSLVPAGWVASRECDGAAAEERLERGICE